MSIGPNVEVVLGDWLRGQDLNLRPSGYEPDELPGCSTPRQGRVFYGKLWGEERPEDRDRKTDRYKETDDIAEY